MKKIVSMLLVVVTLLMGGCQTGPSLGRKKVQVETRGQNEGLILEVDLDQETLYEVKVVSHQETPSISDTALDQIPKAIVSQNSVKVDTVSGATHTSLGIINGVRQAIEEAGFDLTHFEKEGPKVGQPSQKQSYETDVLVVGSGIAGLSAAVQALSDGAKVMVLEKMAMTGGSTTMSGGLILAAESSLAKKQNNPARWQDLAAYWYKVSEEKGDKAWIDQVAKHSGANIDWLMDQGVQFHDEISRLHSSHTFYFGHSTGSLPIGTPGNGSGFTQVLTKKIEKLGGQIFTTTWATDLVVDNGKVVGVKATNSQGDVIDVHAKSVVLATGGFGASEDMMKKYHPFLKAGSKAHGGNSGNTGDGIRMAQAIGAKTLFHDSGIDLGVNNPTYYGYLEGFSGLYVTPEGKRFMDESRFHFSRTRILMDMDINQIWAITDQEDEAVKSAVAMGNGVKADSLEELARGTQMDVDQLLKTVTQYNEDAQKGKDSLYHKDPKKMVPILGPNYYALRLDMGNSGTIGGLVVNLKGQVLNQDDQVISGLYAAGELASGQLLFKEYPGSGSAIAMFLEMGRTAGAQAAQNSKE